LNANRSEHLGMKPLDPLSSLPAIPADLLELMADIGPRWRDNISQNVGLMAAHFTALHATTSKEGAQVIPGLSYGPHDRQEVDVFLPARRQDAGALPALLFVHGGAFVEGDRNRTDQVYANVLHYFARNNVVGVNIGYRLAPDAVWPDASLDVAAAVALIKQSAGQFGIDPNRIFLMGHSAGAAHAASYAYDKRLQPKDGPGLAGLIVVSGRVRADNRQDNPNAAKVEVYYGKDSSLFEDRSPISYVREDSPPTLVAWAEFENPLLDVYSAELTYRLALAKGRSPSVVWLKGHNHSSIVGHINTADEELGRAILKFIERPF
jgi:acetyl esterase/lipase